MSNKRKILAPPTGATIIVQVQAQQLANGATSFQVVGEKVQQSVIAGALPIKAPLPVNVSLQILLGCLGTFLDAAFSQPNDCQVV